MNAVFPNRLVCVAAVVGVLTWGCAPRVATSYTFDKQLLVEADGKFREKNYAEAKKKYLEIVKSFPNTASARTALFKIGYADIYYDNIQANWTEALSTFKLFKKQYPDDPRIDDVNTWIRILVAMETFKSQYGETTNRMERLKNRDIEKIENIDLLRDEYRKCAGEKDTLSSQKGALLEKIKELEETILKIEKAQ